MDHTTRPTDRTTSRAGRRLRATVAALAATAVLVGGCGGSDEPKGSDKTSSPDVRKAALMKRLGDDGTALTSAGCRISAPKEIPASHESGITPDQWSSDPPTSGPHNEKWASWGLYDDVVNDANVVHNFEHGGVGLWFGPELDEAKMDAFVKGQLKDERKWIVVPREPLGGGIAAAAWGVLMTCDAAAVAELGTSFSPLLGAWYAATNSQATEAEKDIPAFEGPLESPKPSTNISLPRP